MVSKQTFWLFKINWVRGFLFLVPSWLILLEPRLSFLIRLTFGWILELGLPFWFFKINFQGLFKVKA